MNPFELLPNPDNVGQMEYRAIHDHIKEVLDYCPEEERFDLAISMLDEFEFWAKDIKSTLMASSKKPYR